MTASVDLAELLESMASQGQTLAVAESLTGGLLASRIVGISGASRTFCGGVVTYATESKVTVLGVDPALLAVEGPVCSEVAVQMATQVAELFGAGLGLSCTGVAGPGEQDGKPVGLVYIAIATGNAQSGSTETRQLHLTGTREQIRNQVVDQSLELLASVWEDLDSSSGYA